MNSGKLTNSQIKIFEMIVRCSRLNYFRRERLQDSIVNIIECGNDLIKDYENNQNKQFKYKLYNKDDTFRYYNIKAK